MRMGGADRPSDEDLEAIEFVNNLELARWLNCGVKPWELGQLPWDVYDKYLAAYEAEQSVRRSQAATAAAQAAAYRLPLQ